MRRQGLGVRDLPAYRGRVHSDSWRHRLHLGQRHASVVQAGQKLRGVSRPAELPSRTDDAALGSLSNEQRQRSSASSRSTGVADVELGSRYAAGGMAQQARRFGLGNAAMAAGMV